MIYRYIQREANIYIYIYIYIYINIPIIPTACKPEGEAILCLKRGRCHTTPTNKYKWVCLPFPIIIIIVLQEIMEGDFIFVSVYIYNVLLFR